MVLLSSVPLLLFVLLLCLVAVFVLGCLLRCIVLCHVLFCSDLLLAALR